MAATMSGNKETDFCLSVMKELNIIRSSGGGSIKALTYLGHRTAVAMLASQSWHFTALSVQQATVQPHFFLDLKIAAVCAVINKHRGCLRK